MLIECAGVRWYTALHCRSSTVLLVPVGVFKRTAVGCSITLWSLTCKNWIAYTKASLSLLRSAIRRKHSSVAAQTNAAGRQVYTNIALSPAQFARLDCCAQSFETVHRHYPSDPRLELCKSLTAVPCRDGVCCLSLVCHPIMGCRLPGQTHAPLSLSLSAAHLPLRCLQPTRKRDGPDEKSQRLSQTPRRWRRRRRWWRGKEQEKEKEAAPPQHEQAVG